MTHSTLKMSDEIVRQMVSPYIYIDKTTICADPLSIDIPPPDASARDVTNGTLSIDLQSSMLQDHTPLPPHTPVLRNGHIPMPTHQTPLTSTPARGPVPAPAPAPAQAVAQTAPATPAALPEPASPSRFAVHNPVEPLHARSPSLARPARAPLDRAFAPPRPAPAAAAASAADAEERLVAQQMYTGAEVRQLDLMFRREQARCAELAAELRAARAVAGACTDPAHASLADDLADAQTEAQRLRELLAAQTEAHNAQMDQIVDDQRKLAASVRGLQAATLRAQAERDRAFDDLEAAESQLAALRANPPSPSVPAPAPAPRPARTIPRPSVESPKRLAAAEAAAAAAEEARVAAERRAREAELRAETSEGRVNAATERAVAAEARAKVAEERAVAAEARVQEIIRESAVQQQEVEKRCKPAAVEQRITDLEATHAAALADLRARFTKQLEEAHKATVTMQTEQDGVVEDTLFRSHQVSLEQTKRIRGLVAANLALEEKVAALHLELEAEKHRSPAKTVADVQQKLKELEARASLSAGERVARAEAEAAELRQRVAHTERRLENRTKALRELRSEVDSLVQQLQKVAQ